MPKALTDIYTYLNTNVATLIPGRPAHEGDGNDLPQWFIIGWHMIELLPLQLVLDIRHCLHGSDLPQRFMISWHMIELLPLQLVLDIRHCLQTSVITLVILQLYSETYNIIPSDFDDIGFMNSVTEIM